MNNTLTMAGRWGALLATSALVLSGCAAGSAGGTAAEPEPAYAALTITDAWVKAADSGMTAAFGELRNDSDAAVIVVAAESETSEALELHETVEDDAGQMTMRQVDGGFVVPARGMVSLEPGGNHIMLMGLSAPLRAGDEATFTLTLADDSTFTFTAPAKDFSGANENYAGDEGDFGRGDEHGEHADH